MVSPDDGRVYSSQTAMDVSGLTYRQLDYFVRNVRGETGLVGSGHQRRFTTGELVQFSALRELLNLGIRHTVAWAIIEQSLCQDLAAPVSINIRWALIAQRVVTALSTQQQESLV